MPLWTLYGLLAGKATTPWPKTDGGDGQEGVFGMPKFDPRRCDDGCADCVEACRPTRSLFDPNPAVSRVSKSITGAVWFASSASRPARPAPQPVHWTG